MEKQKRVIDPKSYMHTFRLNEQQQVQFEKMMLTAGQANRSQISGGPAQPVEIYPLPHLRLTVPGRSDQQGRARLLPAPDESLRPNPGRRGQLQPDRQSHPHQF